MQRHHEDEENRANKGPVVAFKMKTENMSLLYSILCLVWNGARVLRCGLFFSLRYWIIGLTFRLSGLLGVFFKLSFFQSLYGFLLFAFQKENGYTKEFQGSAFSYSLIKLSIDFLFLMLPLYS